MSKLITVFKNLKSKVPKINIGIPEFFEDIRSGTYRGIISRLRILPKGSKEADLIKSTELPAVAYAGVFPERKSGAITSNSDITILDVDNIPKREENRMRESLKLDPHTLAFWTSPSGHGIKIMVKMFAGKSATTYKSRYLDVLHYYSEQHNIPVIKTSNGSKWGLDTACSDIVRMCLYSWDEHIFVNEQSTVFEHFKKYSSNEQKVRAIIEQVRLHSIDITPSYDEWFRICSALCHEFGEGGRGYFQQLSCYYPNYTEEECDTFYSSIVDQEKEGYTIATLFSIAQDYGVFSSATAASKSRVQETGQDIDIYTAEPDEFNVSATQFPVEYFPDVLRQFITENASLMPCPVEFMGVGVLAAVSSAIGKTRSIVTRSGHKEFANLFLAIIADPGSKKSPALRLCMAAAKWKQNKAKEEYDNLYEQYEEQLATWERKKDERSGRRNRTKMATDKIADSDESLGEKPKEPVLTQYLINDATIESVGRILAAQARGVCGYYDELSGWINGFNQFKGKGNERQKWLSLWACEFFKIDRVSGPPLVVNAPWMTLVGAIQPKILRVFFGKNIEDGFIERFLFVTPEPTIGFSNQPRPKELVRAYVAFLSKLYDIQPRDPQAEDDVDYSEEQYSKEIRLDDSANALWEEWNLRHIAEMQNAYFPYYLRGFWSKMSGHTLRFALIFYCLNSFSRTTPKYVTAEDMTAAIALSDFFKHHIAKVMDYCNDTPLDHDVRNIIAKAKKNAGTITAREVYRSRVANCRNTADVQKVFEEMVKRRLGTISTSIPKTGGWQKLTFTLSDTQQ